MLDRAQEARPAARLSPRDVVARALAAVSETKRQWSRSALFRRSPTRCPATCASPRSRSCRCWTGLTDAAVDRMQRVTAADDTANLPAPSCWPTASRPTPADGSRPLHHRRASTPPSTPSARCRGRARRRDADRRAASTGVVARFAESGVTLGDDQAAALRGVLTSGAQVEVLMAAAGTGKSFVVGAIADAWAT